MHVKPTLFASLLAVSAYANPVAWLHGWNSDGDLWEDLQSRMVKSAEASADDFLTPSYYGDGLGCNTDTPIADVAALVAREIQDFYDERGDGVPIDVVCHSMGGLVFRSIVAQECLVDNSILRRYVTLGTPHYGQNAALSYEAQQMVYGSDFLWHLGEAWHFDGKDWPATNTLCIAGLTDIYLAGPTSAGSYWDGLVHGWSASLGGDVPVRYVHRCHSSSLVYAKARAMCGVSDGSKDAVFRLVSDFLSYGIVPDATAPTYGGSEDNEEEMADWVDEERGLWSLYAQVLAASNCVPFSYSDSGYLSKYRVDGSTPDDFEADYGDDSTTACGEGVVQVFGNLPTGGVHRITFKRPDGTSFVATREVVPEPGSCRFVRFYDAADPTMRTMAADENVAVPLEWMSATGLVSNVDCLAACTNALLSACANGYTGAECWYYGLSPWDADARVWLVAVGIVCTNGAVSLSFQTDAAPERVHVQCASSPAGPFADVDDSSLSRGAGVLSLLAEPSVRASFYRLFLR